MTGPRNRENRPAFPVNVVNHTHRYYARLTPGDEIPSVWCGDIDGPNVHKLRNHRFMLTARLHAAYQNWRRPKPDALLVSDVVGDVAEQEKEQP